MNDYEEAEPLTARVREEASLILGFAEAASP
jgi:hypothetical protein